MPDPMDWGTAWPALTIALFGGYLLGSIPFGLVFTKMAGLGDIRDIGSGNIGATNVLRTGNKFLALATLIFDSLKGGAAALIAAQFGDNTMVCAAAGAFLGHIFPVWLKFNGGKGFATYLGVLLAISWPVAFIACGTWLLIAAIFRMSSLSALVVLATVPIWFYYFDDYQLAELAIFLGVLSFIRHHENIRRLIAGKEPKIGTGKEKEAEAG